MEEASSAIEEAGLGLSRERDGEDERARNEYFIRCGVHEQTTLVSTSKLLHFACPLAKRGHFQSFIPKFALKIERYLSLDSREIRRLDNIL